MADPNQQPSTSGLFDFMTKGMAPPPLRSSVAPAAFGSAAPPGVMTPDQAAANAAMIAGMQRPQMGVGISLPYTAAQAVRPVNASPMPFTVASDARYMAAQNAADAQIHNAMFSANHWNPGNTGFMGVPLNGNLTGGPAPAATPTYSKGTGAPMGFGSADPTPPGGWPMVPPTGAAASIDRSPFVGPPVMPKGYGSDYGPGTAFPLQGPNDRGPSGENDWNWYASHDQSLFDPFNRGGGASLGGGGILPTIPQYPTTAVPAMAAGAPAAANAPGGASPSIYDAFMQQESSGGKTAPDNPFQIQPDTFKRFAKDGESYDNVDDKIAASKRFIDYLNQRYNGDPARMAVAYFSGEGNVAPPGSATAWLQDRQDKNGKYVSSYANDIVGRMGAAGAQSAAGAASGGAGMVPGGFRDPYSTNQAAYAEQQARGADTFNRFMRWVNQSPDGFERASRGRIVAELMPLLGPNDIGRAQATGTDAFNQAQGQYWENLNTAATQRYIQDTTPHVAGSAPMMAPNGSTVPFPGAPQYEMGGRMLPAGGMPASGGSDSQEQASTGPKVGAKVREPDGEYSMPGGKTVTVKNGQITAIN